MRHTPLSRFEVRPIEKSVARDIIVANHYSKKWNTAFGTYSFGVFDGDGLAGAIVYGHPMNPRSYRSITTLPQSALVELNRMWIDDRLGPNTETAALARTFKWLRANSPVEVVQTFADGRLGVGTVYKAANFTYYGHRKTLFFSDRETGETYHGTPFSDTATPYAMLRRNHLLVKGRLDAFNVKTHRYLYPLTKAARGTIKLKPKPYPQYEKGTEPLPDYIPPATQIARCLLMAEADDAAMASDFATYLSAHYPPEEVAAAVDKARNNRWVISYREKKGLHTHD